MSMRPGTQYLLQSGLSRQVFRMWKNSNNLIDFDADVPPKALRRHHLALGVGDQAGQVSCVNDLTRSGCGEDTTGARAGDGRLPWKLDAVVESGRSEIRYLQSEIRPSE